MKYMKKYDKKHPPVWGWLNIEQFEKLVDDKKFPKCASCHNPIYHPVFYPENNPTGMCGPCTTGEAETLMIHDDDPDFDWAWYADWSDALK